MEGEPDNQPVLKHAEVSEEECLAENQRGNGNIHRIAYVAIEPGHHQVLRWRYRSRRAQALQRETGKRIEQHRHAGSNQKPADDPQRQEAKGKRRQAPSADLPRNQAGHGPGSKDQKEE